MISMETEHGRMSFLLYLGKAYIFETICDHRLSEFETSDRLGCHRRLTCIENFEIVEGCVANVLNVMTYINNIRK